MAKCKVSATPHRIKREKCLIATRTIMGHQTITEASIVVAARHIRVDPRSGPQTAVFGPTGLEQEGYTSIEITEDDSIQEWAGRQGLTSEPVSAPADVTFLNYSHRLEQLIPDTEFLRRLYNGHIPFLHHSCKPNAVLVHEKEKGKVYALKNIKKGEEITIHYGIECSIERIEKEFGFRCHCSRKCFKRSEGRKPTMAEMVEDYRIRGFWQWHQLKYTIRVMWHTYDDDWNSIDG